MTRNIKSALVGFFRWVAYKKVQYKFNNFAKAWPALAICKHNLLLKLQLTVLIC